MKSLLAQHHELSSTAKQMQLLDDVVQAGLIPSFQEKINEIGHYPLRPGAMEIFQLNMGKMCNQTCKHCHVDAGPDRSEIMSRETMELCLQALAETNIPIVDITGGAPELNSDFRWFVEECRKLGKKVMDRCNLTIILANKKYYDLPQFFAENQVEIVSSLPFYNADRTDRQRGVGVFDTSVKALKMLNEVGYGKENSELILNLVYNPTGAFLSSGQQVLEAQFKKVLLEEHGIEFNNLYAITNMPISRFLEYLVRSGNYESYLEKLVTAFNPSAIAGVMCRNTISIGWDGYIYDCDFNQMLDLKISNSTHQPMHIREFNLDYLNKRDIIISQHCFGCTAGAGSSCGGEVIKTSVEALMPV
ncbi:MAG: arsenosugar biosynthesis radical SAM protein ArsS [Chitinophagales bacterium]|nr:arsenosugar biosynthesis radical SAM protein ArsS [Chitinophagales bacterium]